MSCTDSWLWKTEGVKDYPTEMNLLQSMSLLGLTHVYLFVLFYNFLIIINYGFLNSHFLPYNLNMEIKDLYVFCSV